MMVRGQNGQVLGILRAATPRGRSGGPDSYPLRPRETGWVLRPRISTIVPKFADATECRGNLGPDIAIVGAYSPKPAPAPIIDSVFDTLGPVTAKSIRRSSKSSCG